MEKERILEEESSGEQNSPDTDGSTGVETGEASCEAVSEETASPSDSVDAASLQLQIDRLVEEAQMYKDRWMRLAAEFDNYKKRTGREFNLIVKNANETLITSLLPALDNLGRALQAPQTSEETRTFAEGVVMIRQQFLDVLLNEGLQEIEANRQMFDPARHEALMTVERDDVPAGTIIEVVEKGYTLNDKVIRPAKTLVSRSSVSEQS